MEIEHDGNVFDLGEGDPEGAFVGGTETFRLYHCIDRNGGGECLLQVATSLKYNPNLERGALYLRMVAEQSRKLYEEYSKRIEDERTRKTMACVWNFPTLVGSFTDKEQEGRRINALSFCDLKKTRNLFPLDSYKERGYRIDLRSTGWMVKRLLRTLSLAHAMGILVGSTDGCDFLIEPDEHFFILYNWTEARLFGEGGVPQEDVSEEIKLGIRAVIDALGGNWEKGQVPFDDDPLFEEYVKHLLVLARYGALSATDAFAKFSALINPHWKGKHPFRVLPL